MAQEDLQAQAAVVVQCVSHNMAAIYSWSYKHCIEGGNLL
jgi:hypothetical protein